MKKKLAIFASGTGSNAVNLYSFFKNSLIIDIAIICTNNKYSGIVEKVEGLGIPLCVFSKEDLKNGKVLNVLKKNDVDWIVLAGFLLKIPESYIVDFPQKIINIHPSLLPKFGGKGMYGKHVHKAVIDSGDKESGISIHYVNKNYDEGNIIFQKSCQINEKESVLSLSIKIQKMEHLYFPKIIQKLVLENLSL